MIRFVSLLLSALLLGGCVSDASLQASSGLQEIAVQRMRFAAEAVCLNNSTRRSQDRAARALNFPVRETEGNAVVYVNPGTLTFLRIGPAPDQSVDTPGGKRVTYGGTGCSVGSPAVGIRTANRLVGEIMAPRLVDGSDLTRAPVGAGRNASGGVGLFFDDVAVTLPIAQTTISNPDTGEAKTFAHPVILILHR